MSTGVKAFKSLQKLPKKCKKLPKLVLRLPLIVWGILVKIASLIVILPLDTFSGKALSSTLFLAISTAVSGMAYLIAGGRLALFGMAYAGIATAITGLTFLVAYPLDRTGTIETLIVKTGIRQRNRLSTGLVAVVCGFAFATLFTVLIDYLLVTSGGGSYGGPQPDRLFVGSFLFFLLGVSVSLYVVFQEKTDALTRDQLSIVETIADESGSRELVVENHSDSVVRITDGKIRDSHGNDYTLDRDLKLRPGETASLTLPEGFSLETIESEAPAGLGRFYEKKVTAIIAKSGAMYVLEWEG